MMGKHSSTTGRSRLDDLFLAAGIHNSSTEPRIQTRHYNPSVYPVMHSSVLTALIPGNEDALESLMENEKSGTFTVMCCYSAPRENHKTWTDTDYGSVSCQLWQYFISK